MLGIETSRWVVVCAAALGGALAAVVLNTSEAHGCSCAAPSWSLVLRSVDSPAQASDHSAHWPAGFTLSAYPGHADLWRSSSDGDGVSVLDRVGADAVVDE